MSKQLALVGNWTQEDVQTMKDTLAVGTTDSQFQLFLRTAHASGLNPFLNHIYAITYQGKMSLQIGIEGISHLAKQHPEYEGYDAQTVCANDEFKAKRIKDEQGRDNWEITTHEIGFPRGNIIGCYAIAYRKGFRPFTVLIDWEEVEHFQKSSIPNQQTMWKKYAADMFKKHCGKRALKGQFGIDINEEDLVNSEPSINNIDSYNPPIDVTPAEPQKAAIEPQKKETNTKVQPKQETAKTDKEKLKEINDTIEANFFLLEIETDEEKGEYIQKHYPELANLGRKMNYQERVALAKIQAQEIELKTQLPDEL